MENMNVLVLAYLGDAIYEVYIREHLVKYQYDKVGKLQDSATHYVSAKAQSKFLLDMLQQEFLTEEECDIVRRARNHKSHKAPKGTSIIVYKNATGLEALIGYLYLKKQHTRIQEMMTYIIEKVGN